MYQKKRIYKVRQTHFQIKLNPIAYLSILGGGGGIASKDRQLPNCENVHGHKEKITDGKSLG